MTNNIMVINQYSGKPKGIPRGKTLITKKLTIKLIIIGARINIQLTVIHRNNVIAIIVDKQIIIIGYFICIDIGESYILNEG